MFALIEFICSATDSTTTSLECGISSGTQLASSAAAAAASMRATLSARCWKTAESPPGAAGLGTAELRAAAGLAVAELRAATELGATELGAAELDTAELDTAELGAAELGAAELDTGPRGIALADVSSGLVVGPIELDETTCDGDPVGAVVVAAADDREVAAGSVCDGELGAVVSLVGELGLEAGRVVAAGADVDGAVVLVSARGESASLEVLAAPVGSALAEVVWSGGSDVGADVGVAPDVRAGSEVSESVGCGSVAET
jgi:hypothetical protein